MPIQAVIFDLDGTLLNTLDDLADAGNRVLAALEYPQHPTEAFRRFVGSGAHILCKRMLPEEHRSESEVNLAHSIFDREYKEHMFDKTAPYPGIPALLEDLRRRNLLLGIVSNKPDVYVQPIAERYFPEIFSAVAGPQNGQLKPDPSGVIAVLRKFSVLPQDTLYVGDSDVDMETARNAKVHSCGVLWGFRDRQELASAGANHLVSDPSGILDLVENITIK